jgi:hypothetical protein
MTASRKGEKAGWTWGWLGGFLWVLILALLELAKGEIVRFLTGVCLVAGAVAAILAFSPWRHPNQPYRRLMAPLYLLLLLSLAWAMWVAGGPAQLGLSPWSIFLALPILLPVFLAGRRRWSEGEREDS